VARSSSEQMTSLARKCVGNLCGNMWPVWTVPATFSDTSWGTSC